MIKVKIKGGDDIAKKLESAIRSATRQTFMQSLGREAKDLIYKRTKSGFGVVSDSKPRTTQAKLKKLTANYVKRRKKTKLGKFATPAFSNLTFTGQMLDSLKLSAIRNGFRLEIPDTSRRNSKLSNRQVGRFVSLNGRPFFNLTKEETEILVAKLSKEIRSKIKQVLKSKR